VEIAVQAAQSDIGRARQRPIALLPRITAEEIALHAAFIAKELGERAIWALSI
jgi:hypothetical protein